MRTELQAALVDLNHKSAFDLLLKEAWLGLSMESYRLGLAKLISLPNIQKYIEEIHISSAC
jgi:hypothetical protein